MLLSTYISMAMAPVFFAAMPSGVVLFYSIKDALAFLKFENDAF
jgi:hypothetical protein